MNIRIFCIPLLATLLSLIACASSVPKPAQDNRLAEDFVRPAQGAIILVLPPEKQAGVAKAEGMVERQLQVQLEAAGYRVSLLDESNYRAAWTKEVIAAGGLFDPLTGATRKNAYATAFSNLARHLCTHEKCSMVIQGRIVGRPAKLGGATAEWDGQRRVIPVKNGNAFSYSFNGSTTGLSVELRAASADGKIAFQRFGGAALTHQVNMQKSINEQRTDLFQDDKDVADGVRIALEPLVSR